MICTGLNAPKSGNTPIITGAPRKQWLYLGKIAGNISEEAVSEYLSNVETTDKIIVKKLNTVGSNSAFSIGAPNAEVYNLLNDKDFWPTDAIIRPFGIFFRGGKGM